ncbi:hypothetical protein SEA_FLAPPER_3 [Gordonia phage Flapper]|uniref:Uncharacterized protein n=1 Tax=Gordonia phage Flapper TaxID=2079415 RepID=A0A2L1IX52_9CAUD|nr:hypothetical protein KNT82_gp03 [Gordonia phage Flapper]AVD99748.1 hypothetical protein SEA_FLAPPER_3 [Gordonia phage Flapper]
MTETPKIPEHEMRRETTLNLITATLASAAVQSEKAFKESGWRRFAQRLLDNPKLIIFSDNWLTDEEVAAIYAASRDPKLRVDVRPWNAEPGLVKTAQDTERLQKWMEHNLPGDQAKRCPTTADSAIMAMDELLRERGVANSAVRGTDRLEKWIAENISAGEQAWTRNAFDTAINVMNRLKSLDAENRSLSLRVDDADELAKARGAQLDHLAQWIVDNVDGNPSQSEGTVDTAIRIMREFQEGLVTHQETIESLRAQLDRLAQSEAERIRAELNDQNRRLVAEATIPPQSIEDAKRQARLAAVAEGVPVEEIYADRGGPVAAGKTPLGRNNRFAGVAKVETLLGELAGAASMCWEKITAAGEFDSTKAKKIVEEAIEQLAEIHPEIAAAEAIAEEDDEDAVKELIDDNQVAEAAALYNAIWDPRLWVHPRPDQPNPVNDLTSAAKAFIGGYGADAGKMFVVPEPEHGDYRMAVTNDLLKMVVERIDTLTETVRSVAGAPVKVEDTTFDNGPKTGNDEL